jgi:hypothetical protein
VKYGSLRVLKLVKFRVVKLPGGATDLIPLPEKYQKFSHRDSDKNNAEKDYKNLVIELLQVKTLGPGDYFGNFRGMIAYSNEDVAEPQHEKERRRYAVVLI